MNEQQDSLIKAHQTEEQVYLGWVIDDQVHALWAVEISYLLLTCWITLSTQYWVNYPGLSKRQVLQILKMKQIAPLENPSGQDNPPAAPPNSQE